MRKYWVVSMGDGLVDIVHTKNTCEECKARFLRVTKHDLQQYMDLGENIKSLEDEILTVRTQLERITPVISDSPGSGNKDPDKLTLKVHYLVEVEKELERVVVEKLKKRLYIEKTIGLILSELEQRIVRYRYFEGMKWEAICVRINYEWAQTHRKHAEILIKLNDPCFKCRLKV